MGGVSLTGLDRTDRTAKVRRVRAIVVVVVFGKHSLFDWRKISDGVVWAVQALVGKSKQQRRTESVCSSRKSSHIIPPPIDRP